MSVIMQYILAAVGTFVANLALTKLSGAFQEFGMMIAFSLDIALTPKGLANLRAFREAAEYDTTPTEEVKHFLHRARLWAQIPNAILHWLFAIGICLLLVFPLPDASWIPGLWAACVFFFAGTRARMSIWWLIRSIFVDTDKLAAEIEAWHIKHA
jgi:hypothetical protein